LVVGLSPDIPAVVYVALIVLNGLGLYDVWGFRRLALLDHAFIDVIGLCVGILGLALCRSAQVTMGGAWRVGIDEERSTELIENDAFRYVRKPTYSGFFLLVFGVWLIWPTPLVALVGLLFVVLLEVQVRSEERFLLERHGERHAAYQARTKRYVPWVYWARPCPDPTPRDGQTRRISPRARKLRRSC
jgi:protein-S-isoprenylcysteine O-methyltransferase Ste14